MYWCLKGFGVRTMQGMDGYYNGAKSRQIEMYPAGGYLLTQNELQGLM